MFRFLKVLFLVLLVMAVGAAAGLHLFLRKEGLKLVRGKLQQVFQRDVTIGKVRPIFPLDLVIEDITIQGLGSCRRVIARGGVTDLFGGNFVLTELVLRNPEFTVSKPEEPSFVDQLSESKPDNPGSAAPKEADEATAPASAGEATPVKVASHYVFIKKLRVIDGVIHFTGHAGDQEQLKVTTRNVDAVVRNLQFPVVTPVITAFDISGDIPWVNQDEKGRVELNGWIDLAEKNMRADLTVKDLDGLYFYPYIESWIDLEKANVAKAKVNFDSRITGLKNEVVMDCHLELAELQFKEGQEENREQKMTTAILEIVKSTNNGKIALDFKIRTKMDSPEFGFGVIRNALETKVSEAILVESRKPGLVKTPVRIVGGTVKTAADLTRSIFNGTLGIGKALTSGLRRSFDRKKDKALRQQAIQESSTVAN